MQNEQKKEVKEILYIKKQDLYNFNLYLASLNKNYGTLLVATFVIGYTVGFYEMKYKAMKCMLTALADKQKKDEEESQ